MVMLMTTTAIEKPQPLANPLSPIQIETTLRAESGRNELRNIVLERFGLTYVPVR